MERPTETEGGHRGRPYPGLSSSSLFGSNILFAVLPPWCWSILTAPMLFPTTAAASSKIPDRVSCTLVELRHGQPCNVDAAPFVLDYPRPWLGLSPSI